MTEVKEGAPPAGQSGSSGEQLGQYVVFKIGSEEYAAPILVIQEIIPVSEITPFPNAPEYVVGIINVRGTVATVVNLARRLNLHREASQGAGVELGSVDQYIILTKTEKALFGVQVDSVSSVMNIDKEDIRPVTNAAEASVKTDYVQGVAVTGERVIIILDIHRILEEEDGLDSEESLTQDNQPSAS
jgi:purine-binding chemotaxis protein CheW